MSALVVFSPAKLNLFLAITGRRPDGFHDLVSVVTPVAWGDTLRVEAAPELMLECADPAVPRDETNLVLKAARLFQSATGWTGGARFVLEKRVPIGAGLGGGSSNGTAALVALNQLTGAGLELEQLAKLAAQLGSDCALFLHQRPVVMRGRGDRVELLPPATAARLSGRRVLIFKPSFGISTPWAYAKLAALATAGDAVYLPADEAELRLSQWMNNGGAEAEALLFNSLERPAFHKFVALPALLRELREHHGLQPRMSGSGSACFALLPDDLPVEPIAAILRLAWGPDVFQIVTRLV